MIFDLDGTICNRPPGTKYSNAIPNKKVISKMNMIAKDFTIVIFTSRGIKKKESIMIDEVITPTNEWLKNHDVPYDEIIFKKPYTSDGYYIDDKSLTVSSFLKLDL